MKWLILKVVPSKFSIFYFEVIPHLRWEKDIVIREEVAVGGDSKE